LRLAYYSDTAACRGRLSIDRSPLIWACHYILRTSVVDQLFNSSEKRLARILMLLTNFGKEGKTEEVVPKISQEILAQMVGTTRERVSYFMNKFRKLGLIDYNGVILVHSSLINVVLHD
jgi:CRP/FNR family transcriptional regulator, cyclic AMP receptor protein